MADFFIRIAPLYFEIRKVSVAALRDYVQVNRVSVAAMKALVAPTIVLV
jgi:hypothetical protein